MYICIYIYTHIHKYTSNPQHELYKFKLVLRGTFPKHSSKNPLPKGTLISLFDSSFSLTRSLVHSLMESKVRRCWGQTGFGTTPRCRLEKTTMCS